MTASNKIIDWNNLSGPQLEAIQKALLSAYSRRSALEQMLLFKMNERLNQIAGSGNMTDVMMSVIDWAEKEGRAEELFRMALEGVPGNPALQSLEAKLLTLTTEHPIKDQIKDMPASPLSPSANDSKPNESQSPTTSSSDNSIQAWKYHAGEALVSVDISADGRMVIAGTLENTILSLNQRGVLRWQGKIGNQAWRAGISRNGQFVVFGTGSTRPWKQSSRGIFCFDGDGNPLWHRDLKASVWGLAVSADGSTIAIGTSGKQILLYDNRGYQLWQHDVSGLGWYAWVWCAALSADGQFVAAGAADKHARLFSRGGDSLAECRTYGDVFAVAISDDGANWVAGDNERYLYWFNQQGDTRWQQRLEDKIWAITLSADGTQVLVGAGEAEPHVHLYDQSGKLLWKRHVSGSVNRLAISRMHGHVVVGTDDGEMCILSNQGDVIHSGQAGQTVRDVAISENGKTVVAASEDGIVYGFNLNLHENDAQSQPPKFATASQVVELPISAPRVVRLFPHERRLLSAMFADAQKLAIIAEFTDGQTETRVFLLRSTDREGVEDLPVVAKVGPRILIQEEWRATQRHVLRKLPGFAPVQGEPTYLRSDEQVWGGLRYGQVGDGLFEVESLSRYAERAPLRDLWHVLENRLFRQMRQLWEATLSWDRLHMQSAYDEILPVNLRVEPLNAAALAPEENATHLNAYTIAANAQATPLPPMGRLIRLENFVVTEVDSANQEVTVNLPAAAGNMITSYRLRVAPYSDCERLRVGAPLPPLVGCIVQTRQEMLEGYLHRRLPSMMINLTQPLVTSPDALDLTLPNPLTRLPQLLQRSGDAPFATIHGDLNLRNVLIDPEARTAHIIDCASAQHNHILHDLLRLERDTLTDLLAQIFFATDQPPTAIYALYHQIHCAMLGETHGTGKFAIPADLPPALHKIYIMLLTIRQIARTFLSAPSHWDEYYVGLIIHLLGALKFKNLENAPAGQQPKAIAFWGAATLCWLMDGNGDGTGINWQFLDLGSAAEPKTTASSTHDSHDSVDEKSPESATSNEGSNTSRAISTDERDHLLALLAQHQRNLQLLQKQAANFGAGETPLRLLNQIEAEEERIREIEGEMQV